MMDFLPFDLYTAVPGSLTPDEFDIKFYLDCFFGGAPLPPGADYIASWDQLCDFLYGHICVTKPKTTTLVEHRVYGFEKDHPLEVLFKHVFF